MAASATKTASNFIGFIVLTCPEAFSSRANFTVSPAACQGGARAGDGGNNSAARLRLPALSVRIKNDVPGGRGHVEFVPARAEDAVLSGVEKNSTERKRK
jgi:hypothetical protein